MKKKMLLIYPKNFAVGYQDMKYVRYLTNKAAQFLNAGLATITALTPDEFDVQIVDENLDDIDFDAHYDLVGISGYPAQIRRAKEIAEEFKKRGIVVVCGGSSVSISPERWRSFADVLIIGEAERIWPQFMADFLSGKYESEYRELERFDISISPVPDYSSFSKANLKRILGGVVQTSRGCPYECEFCDVIVYVGRKMRYKPVEQVVIEVEQMYEMGMRVVLLADDNFSAGIKNAKKILRALRDWNREKKKPMSFVTQLSIDIAKDDEFLELAAEAGLNRVFIGIETPNEESLKEVKKFQNLKSDLNEDVKKFHQHGILVLSGCVVGFDHDDLTIFQKQFDFFMKAGIPNTHVYPLTAGDGTPLKERMIKEGRYLDEYVDPSLDQSFVNQLNTLTIMPKQLTLKQLQQGIYWLLWEFYKMENLMERFRIFFENYKNSPKLNKLVIPKSKLDMESLVIVWKILKYYVTKAPAVERKVLKQIFNYARKSGHPQRFEIVVGAFLTAKNIQVMLQKQHPGIENIKYPEPEENELAG